MKRSDLHTDTRSAYVTDYSVGYASSRQPNLTLYADVYLPASPAPLLLLLHGWHGDRSTMRPVAELLSRYYVVVNVDMRGRGICAGTPDVNGWELLDAVDAVNHVRRAYAAHLQSPDVVYCLGVGGGGGNVYTLLAKFPDLFAAGVVVAGVSDYALWYKGNVAGEFRDEMLPWIGCDPYENLNAYKARSGLHLIQNVLSPLLVIHGSEDTQIPLSMTRLYAHRAAQLGKNVHVIEAEHAGHQLKLHRYMADITAFTSGYCNTPTLPHSGVWQVGGYVQTQRHRIELPQLSDYAQAHYNYDEEGNLTLLNVQTGAAQPRVNSGTSISQVRLVTLT